MGIYLPIYQAQHKLALTQIKNKEIKKPQYIYKNQRQNIKSCKKLIDLVLRDSYSWGFQVVSYFLKQIKKNMAWQTIFLCSSYIPNKLLHVEKILSFLPRALFSDVPPPSNNGGSRGLMVRESDS